ncbi:hypothetical protein IJT17_00095 [bacterium]|nr:hypothetical protein [bacterium]
MRDSSDSASAPKLASCPPASSADYGCFDSFCVRCNRLVKPGHICKPSPSAKASATSPAAPPARTSARPSKQPANAAAGPSNHPPELAHLEASQRRIALIAKGLERKPWLMLKDVQRKLPDTVWDEFAAARSGLVARYRKEAWAIMDTLQAGAPLPPKLRRLCELIVATTHGRTFESCGQYLIRSALKPKLAEAYLSNRACPWDNGGKQA